MIANVSNVTAVFSVPSSFGAYFVGSDRSIYAVGFDGFGARENWEVPNVLACADEETTVERGVAISSGNDHALYLATEETTFECTGDTASPTRGPTVPTIAPTTSPRPTVSHAPTFSPAPTGRPSLSSMPATFAPSIAPSESWVPISSSSPTTLLTEYPTPYNTILTASPVRVSFPDQRNGAEDWHSSCGLELVYLMGASLVVMWQWL